MPARNSSEPRRRPRCHTCGKPIHVPKGWSIGAASRRHYWRKHRDIMQPRLGGRGRDR